jgi:hypothetical protein
MTLRRLSATFALAASVAAVTVAGILPASSARSAAATRTSMALADPAPECNGSSGNCWEYYSWYWTYANCHGEGRRQLANNPGRYDNYNCAGGHGPVVWLWLHRP